MGYDDVYRKIFVAKSPSEVDLDAAVADHDGFVPPEAITVTGFGMYYSEATDGAIATKGVISLDHTPAGGSRTEKATYTAEISKAIGNQGAATVTAFNVAAGDQLFFEHKTQQTATEAGKGYPYIEYKQVQ